jgi:hypothetical protein
MRSLRSSIDAYEEANRRLVAKYAAHENVMFW